MGVSGGASENIAIQITTTADLTGVRKARSEVSDLAAATETATEEIAASTNAASKGVDSLTAATVKTIEEARALTFTAENMNAALARNGNSLERATAELEAMAQASLKASLAEEERAQAASQAAAAEEKLAAATAVEVAEERAAVVSAEALVVATEERTVAEAAATAETFKVPGSARTAANALGILSQAAVTGRGSMAGMATAAGGLAFGVSAVIPQFALAAAGIGALVSVGTTLYEVLNKDNDATEKFGGSLQKIAGLTSEQIAIKEAAVRSELAGIVTQIEANDQLVKSARETAAALYGTGAADITAALARRTVKKNDEELLARQKILSAELIKIVEERISTESREEQDAQKEREREALRIAQEAARRREQDARRAASISAQIDEERQTAIDRATLSAEDAAIAKVVRDEKRREQEIRDLQISEDDKTRLLLAAQADRDAQISGIHKDATDRQAQEDARAQEEAERDRERAIEETRRVLGRGLESAIQNSKGLADALTKALLTPLENYLESVAEKEVVEAAMSAASLDLRGAAAHGAVAALAIAGARKVSQIGGLNSGGGGSSAGSGASSGYGNGSTFSPKDANPGSPVVVNLYTTNPYSSDNIMLASYELQRSGITKRPLYLPPTTGLVGAGGRA